MTAAEIAKWEEWKEIHWKMGIDIEIEYKRQFLKDLEPLVKALAKQEALKTVTIIEVQNDSIMR